MDDYVNVTITEGFGDNSTSEGLTLQLNFSETTFGIALTCVAFTITFFGVVGNLATIGKIIRDPKYHTPTFAAIGLLALSDFLSVICFSFIQLTNLGYIWRILPYIASIAFISSFFHVCFLSVVRYLITVHPLQSRRHLTVTAVCLCSLTIWISSGVPGFVILPLFIIVNQELGSIIGIIFLFFFGIIVIISLPLIVCSIVIILHVVKIRTLQSSLSVTDQAQRKMNIVVTVILGLFVLLHVSSLVTGMLYIIYKWSSVISYETFLYMYYFDIFIGCLNFSCNPYILFLSQFI